MALANRLALGTVQFGLDYGISNSEGKPVLSEVSKILDLAQEKGISFLDTANAYGDAENIIGELNNDRFNIVTKFSLKNEINSIQNLFSNGLDRLKTKSVYGLLAHRPMEVVDNPTIWEMMSTFKNSSKVDKIGFSFDSPEEYYAVIDKAFYPDLVQVPFNYLDDRFAEIIKELKVNGCEIHVRSAFLQGLFFTKPSHLHSFFNEVKDLIVELQSDYGDTLAAALLRYVLDNPDIDKVVLGVQNTFQLQNILDLLLSAPKLKKLDQNINKKILQPSVWPK